MENDNNDILIQIATDGFDATVSQLSHLESVIQQIAQNNGLDELGRKIDRVGASLDGMSKFVKKAARAQTHLMREAVKTREVLEKLAESMARTSNRQNETGQATEQTSGRFLGLEKALTKTTQAVIVFWAAMDTVRRFTSTLENTARFNIMLQNMADHARVARGELVRLGTAVEGLGGSRNNLAGVMSRVRQGMQGLRTGRGPGMMGELNALYGISMSGSGVGGLATAEEWLRHVAAKFEAWGDSAEARERKLQVADMAGFDMGTLRMLDEGVAAFDARMKEGAKHTKDMADAVEASLRIQRKEAEFQQSWNDLKLRMLQAAEPLYLPLMDFANSILSWAQQHPTISAAASAIVLLAGSLAKLWAAIQVFAAIRGAKKIVEAAAAAGQTTAATATAGRAARGLGGLAMGPVGLVSSLVDTITGTFQRMAFLDEFRAFFNLMSAWHLEWEAIELSKYNALNDKQLGIIGDYLRDLRQPAGTVMRAARNARDVWNRYGDRGMGDTATRRDNQGAGFRINSITITVNSAASNPEEVARAVSEEFRNQIGRVIDDAWNGAHSA